MVVRCLFCLLLLALPAPAAVATFYVGTYTDDSASEGIYIGTLDTDTGRLGPLRLAAAEKNPAFLALSPDHQFLYAALAEAVESFKVQADGTLQSLGTQPVGGAGVCHVSVDRSGHDLFAASEQGGLVASFPIDATGKIGPRASLVPFTGSGSNPTRQKNPSAESITASPNADWVYACDRGTDRIWQFTLGANATLVPAVPPTVKLPAGSGPRHLVFSGDRRFAYVVNELGVSTSVLNCDPAGGALKLVDTESNQWPGDPTSDTTAAEIALHPSGKWLYVSNRGRDTLSVFAVVGDHLKLVQSLPSPVKFPRSIALDPTGHWLLAAGQHDDRLAVVQVDPTTGKLALTDGAALVGSPACLLFVPDNVLSILQ
jgi:6-phosphogluconolactonase